MNLYNIQKYSINKNFFESKKIIFIREEKNNSKNKEKSLTKDKLIVGNINLSKNKAKNIFWAFYFLDNEPIFDNHEFKLKNDFVFKFLENIKREKVFLKQNKIKISSLENILYEKDISLETLKALALYFKKNLLFINNKKYYLFKSNDDDDYCMIDKNKQNIFYEKIITNDLFNEKIKNKIYMDGTRINLKSVSSYKVKELQEMAEILQIDFSNKKKTKQELYEEITMKIE